MTDRLNNQKMSSTNNKRPAVRVAIIVAAILLLLAIAVFAVMALTRHGGAKGEYHDIDNSETAALEMKIGYERNCDNRQNCNPDEPTYNFLVFVFDDEGRQVRIVRGDDDGQFTTFLPEGHYTLVVSKAFEDITGLPQEVVELKNGQALKLEADYGKEVAGKSE